MQISRARFIEHFVITLSVQCLRRWPLRREPPLYMANCLHRWIQTANGTISVDAATFARIAEPVIRATHAAITPGERPDAERFLGQLWDTLDTAGVEIGIKPPGGSTGYAPDNRIPGT
jgi:hypothetical protein